MLAYLFWHWKQDSISSDQYERLLHEFHSSLTKNPPEGFQRCHSLAIARAPWAAAGGRAYEDWYVLNGSAALDVINDAAVSPPHRESHEVVARLAAGGTAGLYRLRAGDPNWAEVRFASWFSKPPGMTYENLYDLLLPLTGSGRASLWGRQMVLGPSPEFCLHTKEAPPVINKLPGLSIPVRPVWAI